MAPWEYNGVYWKGYYDGPLSCYSLPTRARSGAGRAGTQPELMELYERVMSFGSNSNRNASRAFGSSGLAYILTSLVTGVENTLASSSPPGRRRCSQSSPTTSI